MSYIVQLGPSSFEEIFAWRSSDFESIVSGLTATYACLGYLGLRFRGHQFHGYFTFKFVFFILFQVIMRNTRRSSSSFADFAGITKASLKGTDRHAPSSMFERRYYCVCRSTCVAILTSYTPSVSVTYVEPSWARGSRRGPVYKSPLRPSYRTHLITVRCVQDTASKSTGSHRILPLLLKPTRV